MFQYTIKRLLLIPPTFFMVSLVIFVVLNIAPGRPGASDMAAQTGEKSSSVDQQDSYRIFKEQFNLDKPILFNLRSLLTRSTVEDLLRTAFRLTPETTTAQQVHAIGDLEDFGNYLVRHLIAIILDDDADAALQQLAAGRLPMAAQIRFVTPRGSPSPEIRAQNRAIYKQNQAIKTWSWGKKATADERNITKGRWRLWWKKHHSAFEYTKVEAFSAFFTDTRFFKYWGNLITLDFGVSTADRRQVLPTVIGKLKYSLSLTLVSVLLAYLVAVPIGIYSAVFQNSKSDTIITISLFVLYSLPTFFTGTVLLRLLSEGDPIALFPTGGFESINRLGFTTLDTISDVAWHLVLPVVTYTSVTLAALSRYARSGVVDVIRSDYIRTARAKGLHEFVVIIKHAVRNGMIPILTLLGGLLPVLVSGSVVIEVVFGIPGMGMYLYDAINLRDYNAVMAVLVISSLLTLIGILISDLSYAIADPRISYE